MPSLMATLGLNVTTFKDGLIQSEQAAANFGTRAGGHIEHAGHSFIHAEREGRAFHHLLMDVTEQSPVLGTAMRLAMSPITGIIMGAVMAFKYFNEQLKEANKEMDKLEESGRQTWTNENKAVREASKEHQKIRAEVEDFKESKERSAGKSWQEEALEREINLLKEKFSLSKEIIAQTKPEDLPAKEKQLKEGFLEAKAKALERAESVARSVAGAGQRGAERTQAALDDHDVVLQRARNEEELKRAEKRVEELQKEFKERTSEKKDRGVARALDVRPTDQIAGELHLEQEHARAIEERVQRDKEHELKLRRELKTFEEASISNEDRAGRLAKERGQTLAELKQTQGEELKAQAKAEAKEEKKNSAAFRQALSEVEGNVKIGAYGGDPMLNVGRSSQKSAQHLEHIEKTLKEHTKLLRKTAY